MSKGASWKSLLGFASLALMANRSRAILTIIGVTIGIGSVILVSSLGESARGLIVGEVSGIGANSIFIEPGPGDGNRIASRADLIALNMRDVEALKRLPELDFAIPYIQGNGLLAAEERFLTGQIVGTEPEVQIFDNFTLTAGRFFTSEEARSGARVAVLGSSAAEQLFPSQDPLGRQVSLRRATFTVIGVAAPQGTKFFQDYDKRAYVPYTAAQWYVFGIDYVQFIAARAAQSVPVSVAQEAVEWSLRETNNIDNPRGEPRLDNFRVRTQEEALEILKTVTTAFQALLIAIGAISLLVSGIGIMNIMLVSVIERTKEIGLRRAVGATSGDILKQFLTEALMLTFCGAVFGLLLGAGGAYVASLILDGQFDRWKFSLPLGSVSAALGVAALTGLGFGTYPAWRASRLKPIEALKYEN